MKIIIIFLLFILMQGAYAQCDELLKQCKAEYEAMHVVYKKNDSLRQQCNDDLEYHQKSYIESRRISNRLDSILRVINQAGIAAVIIDSLHKELGVLKNKIAKDASYCNQELEKRAEVTMQLAAELKIKAQFLQDEKIKNAELRRHVLSESLRISTRSAKNNKMVLLDRDNTADIRASKAQKRNPIRLDIGQDLEIPHSLHYSVKKNGVPLDICQRLPITSKSVQLPMDVSLVFETGAIFTIELVYEDNQNLQKITYLFRVD